MRRRLRRDKRGLSSSGAFAIFVALAVAMIVIGTVLFYGWAYPQYQYPMEQSNDYLNLAGATANLTQIAGYVNDSYQLIEKFGGNPVWWYPTPDTSFALLKADMISTIAIALHVAANSNGSDSYAYQQEVTNIHTNLIPNIQSRLGDIKSNYMDSVLTLPGQVGIIEVGVDATVLLLVALLLITRED